MQTENISISLVVWSYPRLREIHQRMSHLSTNITTSDRAPFTDSFTRLPLAETSNRFVPSQWYQLYIASRLLLSIHRSSEIVEHHFHRSHIIFESNVCPSWHSNDINKRQWTTIQFTRVPKLYNHLLLPPHCPHFPQSNGLAEHTVRTVKKLLQGSKDPFLALLSYRTTPLLWCNFSPAELLMGRQLKTDVPQTKDHYIPQWSHLTNLKDAHQKYKDAQSKHYNRRHRVRTLPTLPADTAVWVQNGSSQEPGNIVRSASTPRSYIVSGPRREVRRNRIHLRKRGRSDQSQSNRVMTRLRTGTELRPPDYLRF